MLENLPEQIVIPASMLTYLSISRSYLELRYFTCLGKRVKVIFSLLHSGTWHSLHYLKYGVHSRNAETRNDHDGPLFIAFLASYPLLRTKQQSNKADSTI